MPAPASPPPPVRARLRTALRRAGVAAGVVVVAGAVGGFFGLRPLAVSAIVTAPNAGRTDLPPAADAATLQAQGIARELRVPVGPPAAVLAAWVVDLPAPLSPRDTVVMLHGIRDCKRSMLGLARTAAGWGLRVVLTDLRGHGDSSGDALTYGVVESRDLTQLLDAVEATSLRVGRVGAFGVSYGAATALEWAGRETRVAAVVAVAPFASCAQIVPHYARRTPIVGPFFSAPFLDETLAEAGRRAGFAPEEASPLRAAATTAARVLLIHGVGDEHIPIAHSEQILAALGDRGQLVRLPGEDHFSIMRDASGAMQANARSWFARHLSNGAAPVPPPVR